LDSEAEAVELVAGYDRWRNEQAQREPDTSPRAYVAQRRIAETLSTLRVMAEDAAVQIERLGRVLEMPELTEDERLALRGLIAIAEIAETA
jgi:hypothetical protein